MPAPVSMTVESGYVVSFASDRAGGAIKKFVIAEMAPEKVLAEGGMIVAAGNGPV